MIAGSAMASEYDPLFAGPAAAEEDDLGPVQERFRAASRPFLSPWSWLAWALLLPAAALATRTVLAAFGPAGVLLIWSGAVLAGGVVEVASFLRAGRRRPSGLLAAWALRLQGNLSLVAVALSLLLVWHEAASALPGLWLLLLGHSLYALGGLAFSPMRTCGILYQVGGLAALWPGWDGLAIFAAATAAGNLWMGWSILRERAAVSPAGGRG